MAKIDLLPVNDTTNGWSRILPPRQPAPRLKGEVSADWVVVGAGFAGLSAARRLACNRPHHKVVLLEAHEIGEGASGRNSGFAIDLPHNVSSSLEELEKSHSTLRLARAAIHVLDTQVNERGIACDWSQPGKYHAAVTGQGVDEVLRPLARELDALGEAYQWVEKDALRDAIGTYHFTRAIFTPGCRLMNPAALTRGLGDSLPGNVTVHEHTPVVATDCAGGITLTTPDGEVRAAKMILTVNGFADRFGFYRHRLLSFAAHASLSRRLTAEERTALGGKENWGLTPANAFAGITMRLTRDHRILIRQNIHFCPGLRQSDQRRQQIQQCHNKLFGQRFPMLPRVEMEHTWTGFLCLARNGAPGFGRVADNVYAAVCQNAIGVTKGTIGGLLAADMAAGEDNALIAEMESLGTPGRLPPRPFLDLGVRARFAWEIFRARNEA